MSRGSGEEISEIFDTYAGYLVSTPFASCLEHAIEAHCFTMNARVTYDLRVTHAKLLVLFDLRPYLNGLKMASLSPIRLHL